MPAAEDVRYKQRILSCSASHGEDRTNSNLEYRPDIDGLRAVAVLSVVGFHAFPSIFKSGFVGVDVFFVISGFLISKIILEKLECGNFSFLDFYSRRVRRIFPSLLVVLATCSIFGWLALTPEENALLGKHVVAAAFFASNLLLWSESGYFDVSSETKPLLHLWSLGVEEQFYALVPVVFLIIYRKCISITLMLSVLAIASFGINIVLTNVSSAANFYSPISRMFEFLAGSLLAAYMLRNKQEVSDTSYAPIYSALVGIVLIGAAVFGGIDTLQFPGYVVLAPVVGAVLLIHSGSRNAISRYLLANRIAVFIGLISYPLYLWHWPLLAFARVVYGDNPSGVIRLALAGFAVVLSVLVYIYIEKPIRASKGRKHLFILLLAMVAVAVFGFGTHIGKGETSYPILRLYTKILDGDFDNKAFFEKMGVHFYPCENITFLARAPKYEGTTRCYQSKIGEPVTAIVVGDSHAESIYPGVASNLTDHNVSYYVSGYAPILGNSGFAPFFQEIQADRNIKVVVFAAYWVTATTYAVPEGSSLESELGKAVELITRSGKNVYLIVDNPSFSFPPEQCQYSRLPGRPPKCTEDKSYFDGQKDIYIRSLKNIEEHNEKVKVIDVSNLFCNDRECAMVDSGRLLYRDSNHLSYSGSQYVGSWIASQIH
ncbi:MAG: acyltransferase family protein [Rhodocyclaceae bacterium]|nr:acyltransferase family protein [Rhodocyclaceae bacterium]MDZ4215577.1 acyltransferase family protein [Rhodocyclaceae bacterium]